MKISQDQELRQRKNLLEESIHVLNDREKEILYARRLNDQPITLDELSKKYKISRERIRQIENKAFDKLQKCMLNAAKSKNLLPAFCQHIFFFSIKHWKFFYSNKINR